jgi:hypothetical protein
MKRQRKFCPSVTGLEQRLTLNAAAGHVGDLGASVAQAAVVAPQAPHTTHHHKPTGHHSGGHAKSHVMLVSPADHKTKHHKPATHHHSGMHMIVVAQPDHKNKPHKHVSHKHH